MAERTVGFVGLGNMGGPMAGLLTGAGFEVRGYDASPATLAAAAEATRLVPAASARDVADGSDLVILMLPGSDVVEQVLLGDGLLAAMAPGSLLVDMSSSEPLRTRELAGKAAAAAVRFLDAPVSGGVAGARRGALTVMVGGDEADLAAATPVLEVLAGRIEHAGPVGAGHAVKSLNNLMSATHLLVSCEAVLAGERFGLDPAVIVRIVNGSSGRSASTENKLPNYVFPGTYDTGFSMALMLKDMRIALGLARSTDSPHGLSRAAVDQWAAAVEGSPAGADHTEIARWLEASGRPVAGS